MAGRARGGPATGRGRGRGRGGGPATATPAATATAPDHVQTVGVRRKGFGTSGTAVRVYTNHFEVKIPTGVIHHYDVMTPSEQTLPIKATMEVMRRLQEVTAPQIFTPRAAYDGRKNLFAIRELPFTEGTHTFDVTLTDPDVAQLQNPAGRGPRVYKVKLAKVAEINPEVLSRFLQGKQSHDNTVLTAITALNVVVRMQPTLNYPFNVRSFFTNRERSDIGNGMVLWRGYFQSVRPAIDKMLINIDISTGAMFKPGRLIDVCTDFLRVRGRNELTPLHLAPARGFPERERLRLQRFLYGIRVKTVGPDGRENGAPRVVKRLSSAGANALTFTLREGGAMTVADYFKQVYNRPLEYPEVLCAEVGNGALIPLEKCIVEEGQIMRKQIPSDKVKDVVRFSSKRPQERLNSIVQGLGVLAYGQSEYVRQFGLEVQGQQGALAVNARVLSPPTLRYGGDGRGATITPRDGSWNMVDRKFYRPTTISRWCVAVFEKEAKFGKHIAREMVDAFLKACTSVGIVVHEKDPVMRYCDGQGTVHEQLKAVGGAVVAKHKTPTGPPRPPELIVVILPENATDLYTAVKHFGDITMGVATQCLKATKCTRASPQYYANVLLKVNVKMGGINTIPEPRSVATLTDPHNPTIVMGADVMHPAAHSEGRPSFAALVANVDSDTAKYIADCRVQMSRQEMIEDLEDMVKQMLEMYMRYRRNVEKKANAAPKRIIFYRDGVSEGQFKQVLDLELTRIKQACKSLNINPAITVIVVGKRHHVRFFPTSPGEADKSGNCKAGTVVDREIAHPLELDFYLQSHAGLLGTSRPAHYNVLYDDNAFTPDTIQALSFALCHVYARSTRSVSIPAPVYYADIVCARAKNHFSPDGGVNLEGSESGNMEPRGDPQDQLQLFKDQFRPLHANTRQAMYFS